MVGSEYSGRFESSTVNSSGRLRMASVRQTGQPIARASACTPYVPERTLVLVGHQSPNRWASRLAGRSLVSPRECETTIQAYFLDIRKKTQAHKNSKLKQNPEKTQAKSPKNSKTANST